MPTGKYTTVWAEKRRRSALTSTRVGQDRYLHHLMVSVADMSSVLFKVCTYDLTHTECDRMLLEIV